METFELFDHVHMIHKHIDGIIVDICTGTNGKTYYTVESDVQGYVDDPDAYNGEWPLYDCTADQLEKL